MEQPDTAWAVPAEEVVDRLETDAERGLDPSAVESRREEFGTNRLREASRRSAWRILWEQVKSIIILLLAIAVVVSLVFGQYVEAIAIAVVIVINAAIGFFTELRAVRSMEALQQLGQADSEVIRGGEQRTVAAHELVPGDLVVLEQGEMIGADVRLIAVEGLQVDESPLTGESVPVPKQVDPVEEDASVGDRSSMGFKGTAVTRGDGRAVVVHTGMETEIGGISEMVEEAEASETPLEKRLDALGRRLVWLTVAVAAVVSVSGILAGREIYLMIETGIALAVAAVPEGLPIVATVALARGVRRMVRRNALVRRLSSVETLGSTTVICADKTGTLTENRMRVAAFALPDGRVAVDPDAEGGARFERDGSAAEPDEDELLERAVRVAVLANEAEEAPGEQDEEVSESPQGDPMELALLRLGRAAGMARPELVERLPQLRREPFERETTMMASFHGGDGGDLVAVKGAPEAVIEASSKVDSADGASPLDDSGREEWRERSEAMAAEGLRVLGLAWKEAGEDADPYSDLVLLGLIGLIDPPREDVSAAVTECRDAGIRVVMVTGDHPETARQIAASVGVGEAGELQVVQGAELKEADEARRKELISAQVFARVDPEQKMNLVDGYQERGEILAMTGDGVNDAPALKSADIGIAMGKRGTEVAREASDMVLLDDAFSTIVEAVRHGRVIFRNVRKFVVYLLSGNVGEILAVGAASVAGAPLPLLPLQILYLNLVNDVFPALALGLGKGERHVMERPPRDPQESILERRHWTAIGLYGVVIAAAILGSFFYALHGLELETGEAVTTAFLVLSLGRLLHVFNMRDGRAGILRNEVSRNPFVWGAIAICVALLGLAVYLGPLASVLSLHPPAGAQWAVIAAGSVLPLVVGQLYLAIAGGRGGGDREEESGA
jgi:Ca2+-transporting ATPase